MPLSPEDYGRLAAETLDEPVWRSGLGQPPVPDFEAMRNRVRSIKIYKGWPVLDLKWLPDHKVVRLGIQQPAYVMWIEEINENKIEAVPIPRFGVLQLVPAEVCKDEWEDARREYAGTHGTDYIGELPDCGLYKGHPTFEILAKHTVYAEGKYKGLTCCYREMVERQRTCYGKYMPPWWALVEHLERGWARFEQQPQRRHGTEEATYQERSAITRSGNRTNDGVRKSTFDEIKDNFMQEMKSGRYRGLSDVGAALAKQNKNST